MASTTASARAAPDDRELARLALAGDGDAFARLYDRHERRVFGFCLRMLGSEDAAAEATQETFMRLLRRLPALQGRDLNFIAYALTTARNACYDAIEARRRVEPVGEQLERLEPGGPEPGELALDPERAALLDATRAQVRAANAQLSARQREVLALRELEQLSYEEIGQIIGLNSNAVAQLISRARLRLRELVRGGALASIAPASPDCERALPLLARVQDAQGAGGDELDWLSAHVTLCETCRLSAEAMEEAGVSYRALGPIVALAWLRHATIARAAQLVGADWSHVGDPPRPPGPAAMARGVPWITRSGAGAPRFRGRRRWLTAAAALGVLVLLLALTQAGSIAPERHLTLQTLAPTPPGARPATRHGAGRSLAAHRTHARATAGHGSTQPTSTGPDAPPAAHGTLALAGVPRTPPPRRSHHHGPQRARRRISSPPAPVPATPPPPPASTTPSTPAQAPPPPPPTTTTTAPSQPAGSPPGGPSETGGGCALAVACP